MAGKTGAARVALETGCAVIPVAQWGPQEILPPYSKSLSLLPRKTVHVLAGPPVDLDDLRGEPITSTVLRAATDRILDTITAQLAELRGELPPATRFDPDQAGVPRTGRAQVIPTPEEDDV
jgi:1-acyl-sn-glycerol-3-phosphate acyltransferase